MEHPENQSSMLAGVIEKQNNSDVAKKVVEKVGEIIQPELSALETAELQVDLGASDNDMRKVNRYLLNKNIRALVPEKKRVAAKRKLTTERFAEDWFEVRHMPLQIRKEGQQKYVEEQRIVFVVKNLKELLQFVLERELGDLEFSKNT